MNQEDGPVLLIVQRGRKGKGFSVASIKNPTMQTACSDYSELGEIIDDILSDPDEPRASMADLLSSMSADSGSDTRDETEKKNKKHVGESASGSEDEDEEDEDMEEEEGLFAGVAGSEDPASALLTNILFGVVDRGRKMSSKRVRGRARTKRKS